MARKFKKSKVSICVFCEGESEQAYIDFLKSEFHDVETRFYLYQKTSAIVKLRRSN